MLPRTLLGISVLLSILLGAGCEELPIVSELDLRRRLGDGQKDFICTIVKHNDTESDLEASLSQIREKNSLQNVILGAVNLSNDTESRSTQVTSSANFPLLRCFLGLTVTVDYQGHPSIQNIAKWIQRTKRRYSRQWKDDLSSITSSMASHKVTIVALPSLEQAQDIDRILARVEQNLKRRFTLARITIHHKSKHRSVILQHFGIRGHSAVIVLVKSGIPDERIDAKTLVFQKQDINSKKITVSVVSHLAGIKLLNLTTFEWEALTVKKSERFRPYIVVFYAWWANHMDSFLTLLKSTIEDFQSASVMVRFALVDVVQEKAVMSRYINTRHFKSVPFVAVFQREKGKDTVNQTILTTKHPSTFYLTQALHASGVLLQDVWGKIWEYSPYKRLDYMHYSDVNEGPWGQICTAWASNLTDCDQPLIKSTVRSRTKKVQSVADLQRILLEKVMPKADGIPVMSEALWDAVMERSQVKVHAYSWHRDVRVTLLAFVKDGCGSCRQKMQMFKELRQELLKSDNSQLFLVNCSRDVRLCQNLEVQGFPSLVAFRNFVTLLAPECELSTSDKPYIRRDYHGPIATGEIITWLRELTQSSMSVLALEDPGSVSDLQRDVRLIATVIPKNSHYLPLAPRHNRDYFYSLQCFRVVCERLFGLASCQVVYSKEIPAAEFTGQEGKQMVVSQIAFGRKDGVSINVMSLGRPLLGLLEGDTAANIHTFHNPHHYALSGRQKCEDDHNICTQILISFTLDHLRLPVTLLTSEIFHTQNNPLFQDEHPVLIGLGHTENLTESSLFMQMLHAVAAELYNDITVTVMDVDLYPAWAGSFVPKNYYRFYAGSETAGPMHTYPRICLVNWRDHSHAAFYPPFQQAMESIDTSAEHDTMLISNNMSNIKLDEESWTILAWEKDELISYLRKYLTDPLSFTVQTEHF